MSSMTSGKGLPTLAKPKISESNLAQFSSDELQSLRARLITFSELLDSAVRLPGVGTRVGLDALLNFIPGIGTVLAQGLALYPFIVSRRLGLDGDMRGRMIQSIVIDTLISSVPLVGWVADVFYRANHKNVQLLIDAIDEELCNRLRN
jgi:hypothetical protein